MPVKHVQLVGRKNVELRLERIERLEIPPGVMHKSAQRERRPVRDAAGGDVPRAVLRLNQLPKRLHAIE